MKTTNTMPTDGQFVAVWEHNGGIWSDIYSWIDGALKMYSEETDEFEDPFFVGLVEFLERKNATFITL